MPHCCFEQRYFMVFLLALSLYQGTSILHMLTSVINIMITPAISNSSSFQCNFTSEEDSAIEYRDKRGTNYNWNEWALAIVVHFFYFGYAASNVVGGYLADKYGGKFTMLFIITALTTIQFATPGLIDGTDGHFATIKVLRVASGFIEGMRIPTILTLLAHWIPKNERGRMISFVACGALAGVAWHHVTVVLMYKYQDWAVPFYLSGAIGAVLAGVWFLSAASYPTTSNYIQLKEKLFLESVMKGKVVHGNKTFPLRSIFCSRKVVALCFGLTGDLWNWHFSQLFIRGYMKKVMNFDVTRSKTFTTVPVITMAAMTLSSGFLSDWLVNTGRANKTLVRKVFAIIALMGSPIYMIVGSYTVCHVQLAQAFFLIATSFEACVFTGTRLVPIDMAANYAGFLTGLCMTPVSVLLMFAPQLADWLVPNETLEGYRRMFYLTFGISSVCCLVFVVFAEAHTQEWNTLITKGKKIKGNQNKEN